MATGDGKLDRERLIEVATLFGCYQTPLKIANLLKSRYGIDIKRQSLTRYCPMSSDFCGDAGLSEAFWTSREEFEKSVEGLRSHQVATVAGRVTALAERWDSLEELRMARAEKYGLRPRLSPTGEKDEAGNPIYEQATDEDAIGATGAVALDVKFGRDVYEFDAAVYAEQRAIEDQIAKELGQRIERKDLTSGGKALSNVVVYLPDNGRNPVETES